MRKIFWGLIFLFFDFYISIGACKISFMPVFVGYLLISAGSSEMETVCDTFKKVVLPTKIMVVWGFIIWLIDILGIYLAPAYLFVAMIISCAGSTYSLYNLTKAVLKLDEDCDGVLESGNLFTYWICYAVATLTAFVVFIAPLLAVPSMIVGLVFGIIYTVKFYRISVAYESLSQTPLLYGGVGLPEANEDSSEESKLESEEDTLKMQD